MLPHCRGAAVKPVPSVTVNMTVVLPSSPGGVAESWHQLAAFLASDLGQDSLPSLGPLRRLGKASPPTPPHPRSPGSTADCLQLGLTPPFLNTAGVHGRS